MPNNELQELLSARFEGHTHSTNEAVWSAIEAELDASQSDRVGIWFWVFNGIAATILFGLMFQTGNRSTISAESSGVQLSETIQKESSSDGMNNTHEAKTNSNLESAESNNDDVDTGSSTFNNGAMIDYSALQSPKPSQQGAPEPGIQQTLNLPEVSTYFEGGLIVATHTGHEYRDFNIDELPIIDIYPRNENPTILKSSFPAIARSSGGYFNRLPIYVGCEFTLLNRRRVGADAIAYASDSSYASSNDRLAYNRHFELSLFSQFDFTKRFSASIGFGYSRTKFSFYDDSTAAVVLANPPKKSVLQLFTIPVQAKFKLIQKNRFGLSAGLTFQSEFGSIVHKELDPGESWSTTGTATSVQNQTTITNSLNIRQFAFEPFVQFSVNITPRISSFANLGYRMYLNQEDKMVAPIGPLSYFNADIGLLFRLR